MSELCEEFHLQVSRRASFTDGIAGRSSTHERPCGNAFVVNTGNEVAKKPVFEISAREAPTKPPTRRAAQPCWPMVALLSVGTSLPLRLPDLAPPAHLRGAGSWIAERGAESTGSASTDGFGGGSRFAS